MKILTKVFLIFLVTSCANMVMPTGGDKDIIAPKLVNIAIIENEKNTHNKTIAFEFDEYIQLNKWEEFFYISPPIKKRIQKKVKGQTLFVTIEDSLNQNTTYFIALNSCIKDNNEGNILDTLNYKFSIINSFDTLSLSGRLQDAYTLAPLENAWIMLFNEELKDTLIFKETPNYIAKTDKNGVFHFPNLKAKNYKVAALTEFDFIYNEGEKIAFSSRLVNAKKDSFISLFGFDPIIQIDSAVTNSTVIKPDSIISKTVLDSTIENGAATGKLLISTNISPPCIFQLLQSEKVMKEIYFTKKPYLINKILAGKYHLKYIADNNRDSVWNTGSWDMKIQPEEVANYRSEITIRANWDLDLEWTIGE